MIGEMSWGVNTYFLRCDHVVLIMIRKMNIFRIFFLTGKIPCDKWVCK